MKKSDSNQIPEFNTLAEEREYWEEQGPLAEGYKGTISKPKTKQKRASFLSVRLTGEELTQLRDIAARLGMGPSTFARAVLKQAIERDYPVTYETTLAGKRQSLTARNVQPQYVHDDKPKTGKDDKYIPKPKHTRKRNPFR